MLGSRIVSSRFTKLVSRFRKPAAVAAAAALIGLTLASGAAGASSAAAASNRIELAGTAAPAQVRQHVVGAVSPNTMINFDVVLQLRNTSAAQSLVEAVSTPGSSEFRHYLTAKQWEAKFSPTASSVSAVEAWMRSEHLKVVHVPADRITIEGSGTAKELDNAFGTKLENYRNANGQIVRYASQDFSVPETMSKTIIGALGINEDLMTPAISFDGGTTAVRESAGVSNSSSSKFPPAPAVYKTAPPCGSYIGQTTTTVKPAFGHGYPKTVPNEACGYLPSQFRSAYGLNSSDTGKGVTVAIVDAYGSATISQDATTFYKAEDPSIPFADATFAQRDAFPFDEEALCDASSWLTEQDIDVESVHTMAPDAHILYVGAKSCLDTDLFNAQQEVVDNSLANVMTDSWADTGGDLFDDLATRTAFDDLFMMADTTGISVLFSSGDDGDNFAVLGMSVANYPSESPYVTGVGGTTMEIGSKGTITGDYGWYAGRYFLCTKEWENIFPDCTSKTLDTWGPFEYDGGSGGFTSYNYTQPWYQAPVVPTSLSQRNSPILGPVSMRVIPDISMDADPSTGELNGYHQIQLNGKDEYSTNRWGGTSLASPLLAGLLADVDQAAVSAGGAAVGFINPAIYRLYTTSGAISSILPPGKKAMYRGDHAYTYVPTLTTGYAYQYRTITYEGPITYCDGTGNCATRRNTLSTGPGYNSMTGLGTVGPNFLTDLANF
jgi:subtilase family serine protease